MLCLVHATYSGCFCDLGPDILSAMLFPTLTIFLTMTTRQRFSLGNFRCYGIEWGPEVQNVSLSKAGQTVRIMFSLLPLVVAELVMSRYSPCRPHKYGLLYLQVISRRTAVNSHRVISRS